MVYGGSPMPIMSYLVWPVASRKNALISALQTMPECEVRPAENHELLVLVTETENEQEEKQFQVRLKDLQDIACLALVSGYNDADIDSENSEELLSRS